VLGAEKVPPSAWQMLWAARKFGAPPACAGPAVAAAAASGAAAAAAMTSLRSCLETAITTSVLRRGAAVRGVSVPLWVTVASFAPFNELSLPLLQCQGVQRRGSRRGGPASEIDMASSFSTAARSPEPSSARSTWRCYSLSGARTARGTSVALAIPASSGARCRFSIIAEAGSGVGTPCCCNVASPPVRLLR
jgi:hypothetical protein